jgi:type IV secretion system protein TrbC
MKSSNSSTNFKSGQLYTPALALTLASLLRAPSLFAQAASPWENAVNLLETSFTGPLARGLSLIAIVIGGLMFAFGEGQSKKVFAGIVFGLGIALGAVNFMSWLFGVA